MRALRLWVAGLRIARAYLRTIRRLHRRVVQRRRALLLQSYARMMPHRAKFIETCAHTAPHPDPSPRPLTPTPHPDPYPGAHTSSPRAAPRSRPRLTPPRPRPRPRPHPHRPHPKQAALEATSAVTVQARARGWAQRRVYRATVAHLAQLKVRQKLVP